MIGYHVGRTRCAGAVGMVLQRGKSYSGCDMTSSGAIRRPRGPAWLSVRPPVYNMLTLGSSTRYVEPSARTPVSSKYEHTICGSGDATLRVKTEHLMLEKLVTVTVCDILHGLLVTALMLSA